MIPSGCQSHAECPPSPFLIALPTALLTSQTLGVRHKSWKLKEWFTGRTKMHMAAISFFPTLIFMPIPIWKYYSSYSRSSHILKEVQRRVLLTVLPLGISVSLGDPFSCWQAVKSGSKHLEPASKQLLWRVYSHCLMHYAVCWCWHYVFNLFVRVTARENWMETLYKSIGILIAHDCHTNYLLATLHVCCLPWASFYQLQSCLILLVCSEIIETF